jgi:Flp pilus assembly protein TadG
MARFPKLPEPADRSYPRRRGKQRGVAAVEAGLVSLFLVSIVIGVVEFGRAIFYFDSLTKSARAAARYVVTRDSADPTVRAAAITQGQQIALCYATSCGSTSTKVAPGLLASNISIRTAETTGAAALANVPVSTSVAGYGTVDLVTVTIGSVSPTNPALGAYTLPSVTGFIFPLLRFSPISVTMARVN